jgi:hypothetical protein
MWWAYTRGGLYSGRLIVGGLRYSIADGGNRPPDNHHGAKEIIVLTPIFHDNFETYTYMFVHILSLM